MLALDLFSGVGGLGFGFRRVGFRVVGFEVDERKARAYALNVGEAVVCDVRWACFRWARGRVDVLVAGPPCRPYSRATPTFRRGCLHPEYGLDAEVVRVAGEAEPRAVAVEEVVGWSPLPLAEGLARLGYSVHFELVAFSEYGVPTLRRRWIVVALRGGDAAQVFRELRALREPAPRPADLIADLPEEAAGWLDHRTCRIKSRVKELVPYIPPGHSFASAYKAGLLPAGAAGAVKNPGSKHSYWLYRVPLEGLVKVVPHPRRSMVLHPVYDRMLTVRELARLMSYPDTFTFAPLNTDEAMKAISESVPPKLSEKLAKSILAAL